MTNIILNYPILLIRKNDKNLYGMEKDLGLISKGGDSFYKRPIKLIDKYGNMYKLDSAENNGEARLIDSIRYFQKMHQMKLEFHKENQLSLEEFKVLILNYIGNLPKHWNSLGTKYEIGEWVKKKTSISDIINMFR